jgi:GNAT superfamily N-acetyltransferase
MSEKKMTIRQMSQNDLQVAIDWAAAEGWNPGKQDAASFYNTDPDGFFMGLLDDEPVASISAVRYGDNFGFIGFYIVKDSLRGNGLGGKLADAAINYLEGRNIGLDGVVDQQEYYQRHGFSIAHRNIRFACSGGGEKPDNFSFSSLVHIPFEKLADYDAQHFFARRDPFLKSWISAEGHYGLALIQQQQIRGYGVIRPCVEGYKIGPLFAENGNLAEVLFLALKSHASEKDAVYLDIPETNKSGLYLAEKYEMKQVFETARMYNLFDPKLPLNKIFGITTFELG